MKQSGTISIVFKLMDQGLSSAEIDLAMSKMVGPDWRELSTSVWYARLTAEGYLSGDTAELSVDDLEALINGCIKLNILSGRQ